MAGLPVRAVPGLGAGVAEVDPGPRAVGVLVPVRRRRAVRRAHGVVLTARDERVLAFLAEFRLATIPQLAQLCAAGEDAMRVRLDRLARARLVEARRFGPGCPRVVAVSRRGLDLLGSPLPATTWAPNGIGHGLACTDVAVQLISRGHAVVGERVMRRVDQAGVGQPGWSPVWAVPGANGARWPDLVITGGAGGDVVVEVETASKGSVERLVELMGDYVNTSRYAAVQYWAPRVDLRLSGMLRRAAERVADPRISVHEWFPLAPLPGFLLRGKSVQGLWQSF